VLGVRPPRAEIGRRFRRQMTLLLGSVALDGDQDEHQGQDREDESLDQVEERLEADEVTGTIARVSAVMTVSATSPP